MNTNRKLQKILLLGAALTASALAGRVYAADATLSFTGEIIPASNGAKAAATNKESSLTTNKQKAAETSVKQGEDDASR